MIGRGGMGSVWEGRHTSLGSRVAIKFIDADHAASKEAQARFVHEAKAAARIQSRHAVQILDHGVTDDGHAYMVMELLVGETLDKRIARIGRLTLDQTAKIVGQICRALQRAHDGGIIHRDLKPDNVFLVRSPDEDEEIAKVLDFGVAKFTPHEGDARITSGTKTGAVLGTPYYMSPEQARGLRSTDWRTDLWSLGVIAYECVTGCLPFEGESVGDLLVKICTSNPPLPSEKVADLPAEFDAWFVRALDRDPLRRFESATDLADSLTRAIGGSPNSGPFARTDDPSAVHSKPAILGTSGSHTTPGALATSRHAGKERRRVAVAISVVALICGATAAFAFSKMRHVARVELKDERPALATVPQPSTEVPSTLAPLEVEGNELPPRAVESAGHSVSPSAPKPSNRSIPSVSPAAAAQPAAPLLPRLPPPALTPALRTASPRQARPSSDPGY